MKRRAIEEQRQQKKKQAYQDVGYIPCCTEDNQHRRVQNIMQIKFLPIVIVNFY